MCIVLLFAVGGIGVKNRALYANVLIISRFFRFPPCWTGLIKRKDALIVVEISSQWTQLRKQLRLIEEREDNVNQDSISYVSAGTYVYVYFSICWCAVVSFSWGHVLIISWSKRQQL